MAAGAEQPEGRYVFRVTATDAAGAAARAAPGGAGRADPRRASCCSRNRFPILGAAPYGDGAGALRRRRAGTHQGQDVFADCGTPLVAARGGDREVQQATRRGGQLPRHRRPTTGTDYAYMHLRDPALVAEGDRVATGQLIGYVGDTGDADGCHLHFEMWTAPGW